MTPSVRACRPSATSAAEPILRPVRNPVPGRQLVTRESGQRGQRHRDQIRHVMRVDQAGERLPGGQRRGRRDHQHDHDPGQILSPAVPIGVTAGRRTAPQHERHPQRHSRQRVRRVVQRVTQQRHRPRQPGHHRLDQCGQAQHSQRDPQRPHPLGAALHHRVDLIGRLVRMRPQHMAQPGPQSRLAVLVAMFMVMAGTVIVAGVMAARVRMAHNAQDACETLLQHLNHSGPGAPASGSLFRPAPGPICGVQQSGGAASRNGLPRPPLRQGPGARASHFGRPPVYRL